jgi:hypothetical protein
MESHKLTTIEKFENAKIILKMQDTTELNFTSQKAMEDIGYLANSKCSGLLVHTTLSVTETGIPVGIINQKVWARDYAEKGKKVDRHTKKIEDKESYRWLESFEQTEKMFLNTQTQVMIGDRESDIYELFEMDRQKNSHFLVRATQNRLIEHVDRKLFTALENSESKGNLIVEVDRKKGQSSRTANLVVKYETFKIKAPKNSKKDTEEVELNVILVEELDAPEGIEPIKWILITTLDISCLEDALKYVRWYSYRWLIERYHYVLKSGCQIEKLQLDSGDKIQKALSIYSIIACKLLNLTYHSRKDPESSCESSFEKKEWEMLYVLVHRKDNFPKETPKLKDVVLWIAQLGGFLARKHDGEPGVKTIWRGYRKFMDILEGVNLLQQFSNKSINTYG